MLSLLLNLAFAHTETVQITLSYKAAAQSELPRLLHPGQPMLPFYPVAVLLPFGEEYSSLELVSSASALVEKNAYIDFAKHQHPISNPWPVPQTFADASIYSADALYPASSSEYLGTQYYRGYGIALFNLYPYRYNPLKKELYFTDNFQLNVHSVYNENLANEKARFVSTHNSTKSFLESYIANPSQLDSYHKASQIKSRGSLPLSDAKEMLIITKEHCVPWFDEYIAFSEGRGISTGIYSMEFINQNYSGVDNAEKLRNFLIDAYTSWTDAETPLEYVILAGDDEIVPERGVYGRVWNTIDRRMPSDLYYSNLDGDWNANGNEYYGEMDDDTDMLPEFHIGRFTAERKSQFDNIFHKIRYYLETTSFSNNVAIFFGENLNNNPLTWGGDYKDEVAAFLPEGYRFYSQYQRDNTYSSETVVRGIEGGANVMNHMGHANYNILMGLGPGTAQQLKNTEYGFLYTQGCYPAAFDQRTSQEAESVGEQLLAASGGVFGFVGNTRYGWYMPGGTDGASQFYDRDYFKGLFEAGYPELGKALTYSRLQNLNNALASDVMRWCYMEMILFGDPSIPVKMPQSNLPMLRLSSYEVDDLLGDADGVLNPNETIRIIPIITNEGGWDDAEQVKIKLKSIPSGASIENDEIIIEHLAGGESSDGSQYFSLNLSNEIGFGLHRLELEVDSVHPVSGSSTGKKSFEIYFETSLIESTFPWETTKSSKSAPIVAPILEGGKNGIIFADDFGKVDIIDSEGKSVKSFEASVPQNIMKSFAMGSLTPGGDGRLEIVVIDNQNSVYILDERGELAPGYPFTTYYLGSTPATLVDFEGDGVLKLVSGYSTGALLINLRSQANKLMPWTVYRGSLMRQGAYKNTDYHLSGMDNLPVKTKLMGNFPNPFNPETTLSYYLKEGGVARLDIYNMKGQKVRTLFNEVRDEGFGQAIFDGKDDKGNHLSGGVYFYMLRSGKDKDSKKMLMLK